MEHVQELQSLDQTTMADAFEGSGHNEPETWYKVVRHVGVEETTESSLLSDDEPSLSHGENPRKLILDIKPSNFSQTRTYLKTHDHTRSPNSHQQDQSPVHPPPS